MTNLLTVFLSSCIAINLQLVFLHGVRDTHRYEKWYYIGSVGLAVGIPGIGFFAQQYGYSAAVDSCWFVESSSNVSFLWQCCVFFGWISLVAVYSVGAIVIILVRINKHMKHMDAVGVHSYTSTSNQKQSGKTRMLRMMRRIVLYPAVPIATQVLSIIYGTYVNVTGRNSYPLYFASLIGAGSHGILNTLVFITDPSIVKAAKYALPSGVYRCLSWLTPEELVQDSQTSITLTPVDATASITMHKAPSAATLYIPPPQELQATGILATIEENTQAQQVRSNSIHLDTL
jgi:hypothetical protein